MKSKKIELGRPRSLLPIGEAISSAKKEEISRLSNTYGEDDLLRLLEKGIDRFNITEIVNFDVFVSQIARLVTPCLASLVTTQIDTLSSFSARSSSFGFQLNEYGSTIPIRGSFIRCFCDDSKKEMILSNPDGGDELILD
ncbi:hypothetical protein LWI28_011350 [Acer negundo]|uniref:Uncharacterized protein n=1 Tax=Acer negundo TaxID=4023 RepID=A0AAD5JQT5_ACENE|nr:hypothetical protein LWI28_011350 [Acer negundo]